MVTGLLFEKPSTRTRTSFEVAVLRLGGKTLYLATENLQTSRNEPIKDTARMLGDYLDLLIARVYSHDTVLELSKYAKIPVINGLSDLEHPTQVLCDLFTIYEHKGFLKGLKMAYIGDGNNVCNSLLLGAALTGMNINVACPQGYQPDEKILETALDMSDKTKSQISIINSPNEASKGAEIIYTDVWISMGQENEKEDRMKDFQGYQINKKLLKVAAKDVVVMHCLPAHRGLEITEDVLEGENSLVWTQAQNKLYGAAGLIDFINDKSL
jgi:ornithine carbamoyltransferase